MDLFRRAENSKAPAACSSRITSGQCGFSGNSDLYGLGIRLGIYLQLLAMTWAMVLFGKKGHDQVVTYNVFILSFIIALFVVAFNDECVFEVELIILQYIIWSGCASIYVWIYLIFGEDGATRKGTGLVMGICFYPILAYGFYFWLSIVRDLPARFTPTPCGTSYFLFARIDSHNFKKASTAILVFDGYFTACIALALLGMLGVLVYYLLKAVYRGFSPTNQRINDTQSHADSNPAGSTTMNRQNRRRSNSIRNSQRVDSVNLWGQDGWNFARLIERIVDKYPHLVAAAFNFTVLIWTILAVELPIRWNHISDVYSLRSTGQFIPLITGIANLIIIGYKFVNPEDDDKSTEEEPHDEEDLSHQNGQSAIETQEPPADSTNEERQPAERQLQEHVEAANEDHPAAESSATGGNIPARLRKRHTK